MPAAAPCSPPLPENARTGAAKDRSYSEGIYLPANASFHSPAGNMKPPVNAGLTLLISMAASPKISIPRTQNRASAETLVNGITNLSPTRNISFPALAFPADSMSFKLQSAVNETCPCLENHETLIPGSKSSRSFEPFSHQSRNPGEPKNTDIPKRP